jgi:hypothetical protein
MIKFKREIFSFSIGYLIWAQANYLAHTLDHEVKKATGGSFLLARKCLTSGRKRFPSYAAWNWWPVACSFHCNKCQSFMNHCPAHQPLSHDLKTKIIISYQTPTFDTSMSGFFFLFFSFMENMSWIFCHL